MRNDFYCYLLYATSISFLAAQPTSSAFRYEHDETRWLSIGGGLRTTFNYLRDYTFNGNDSKDFEIDNFRLYFNGQVHEYLKFQINTERDRADDDIRLLDGIGGGRHKLASDRGNLNSAFTIVPWDRISIRRFPNEFAGRDDGFSVWGEIADQSLKYYVQVFDGAPADGDDLL